MKRLLLAGLLVRLALPVFAADVSGTAVLTEPGYSVTASVDWVAAALTVQISHALDPATPSLTRAKGDAETDVDARLDEFLQRAIAPLTVDSSHVFDDLLGADPLFAARVRAVAEQGRRTEISLSPDFSSLVERYVLPLFGAQGVASPLYPSRLTPTRPILADVTARVYTGLLIDARGGLPDVGTSRTAVLHPALFPRIWDEHMNLVLDVGRVDPQSLASWGMVGYARGLNDDAVVLRAGNLPLRLVARGVYGTKGTDVVISADGARQLLSLQENISLLQQGRVVIVCDGL